MHWPRAKDADVWILILEEIHRVHQESILVDVEHVKAYRTKKENYNNCRSSNISSLKAMRKQISQRIKERCRTEETWPK